jgi:hypothetical protein
MLTTANPERKPAAANPKDGSTGPRKADISAQPNQSATAPMRTGSHLDSENL